MPFLLRLVEEHSLEKENPTQSVVESQSASISGIYFNGFELGSTLSDIGALLMLDGQPQAKLSMSFTTAKTLCAQLNAAIESFEQATGQNLLTMEDVGIAFQKSSGVNEK